MTRWIEIKRVPLLWCLDPVHAGCVLDDRMFCVNLGHMRVAVCALQDPCASSCQSLSGRIPRELHDLRVGAQAEVRQKHWDSSELCPYRSAEDVN